MRVTSKKPHWAGSQGFFTIKRFRELPYLLALRMLQQV